MDDSEIELYEEPSTESISVSRSLTQPEKVHTLPNNEEQTHQHVVLPTPSQKIATAAPGPTAPILGKGRTFAPPARVGSLYSVPIQPVPPTVATSKINSISGLSLIPPRTPPTVPSPPALSTSATTPAELSAQLASLLMGILHNEFLSRGAKALSLGDHAKAAAYREAQTHLTGQPVSELLNIFQNLPPAIHGDERRAILDTAMKQFKQQEQVIRTNYALLQQQQRQRQSPQLAQQIQQQQFAVQLQQQQDRQSREREMLRQQFKAHVLSEDAINRCLRRLFRHHVFGVLKKHEVKSSRRCNYADAATYQRARVSAAAFPDNDQEWMRDLLSVITEAELDVIIMEIKKQCEEDQKHFLELFEPGSAQWKTPGPWCKLERPAVFGSNSPSALPEASLRLRISLMVDTALNYELGALVQNPPEWRPTLPSGYAHIEILRKAAQYRAIADQLEQANTSAELETAARANRVGEDLLSGLYLKILEQRLQNPVIAPSASPAEPAPKRRKIEDSSVQSQLRTLALREMAAASADQATTDQMKIFACISLSTSISLKHEELMAKLIADWKSWSVFIRSDEWIALELQYLLGESWRSILESLLRELGQQLQQQPNRTIDEEDLGKGIERLMPLFKTPDCRGDLLYFLNYIEASPSSRNLLHRKLRLKTPLPAHLKIQ